MSIIINEFDGFRVEVNNEESRGDIILSRSPLNVIQYSQRIKMAEAMKDLDKNELIVGQGFHHPVLYSDSCYVEEINMINLPKFEGKMDVSAKFRYRQQDVPVSIEYVGDDILVSFKEDVRAVTPGQAAVFYDGEVCLGGGFIKEAYKDNKKRKY